MSEPCDVIRVYFYCTIANFGDHCHLCTYRSEVWWIEETEMKFILDFISNIQLTYFLLITLQVLNYSVAVLIHLTLIILT